MNTGEIIMIKKFSVKNFKNFKEKITLDFSKARDYSFNQELIKNGLINKMLIYGPNNSGKSNLGAAIMDITTHLTDNFGVDNIMRIYYINGNSVDDSVDFKYEFFLNGKNIEYSYKKNYEEKLLYEELIEEGNVLFKYNYKTNKYENNIEEAKTLDISKRTNKDISVLKYIYNNTLYWNELSPVKLLMEFVSNMLWFRSVRTNEFMGLLASNENINDFIIKEKLLPKFEKFLKDCGQNYKLVELDQLGKKIIGVKYKNFVAPFNNVASTGTLSLWLFFYWMNRTDKISFVYLDEFDAFYHYELSTTILKYINNRSEFQSVLTSYNTFLINNELMRPDCYAILKNGKISTFADSTNKTIRQGHNLEKMMLKGEFETNYNS
jgi:AAA15 family ATPase/GTPase